MGCVSLDRSSLGGTTPGCAVCRLFRGGGGGRGAFLQIEGRFGVQSQAVQSADCLDTYGVRFSKEKFVWGYNSGCAVCILFGYVRGCFSTRLGIIPRLCSLQIVWIRMGCVSPNKSSLGGTVRYRLIRFLPWIVKPILRRSFRKGCSSTC